MGEVVLKAEASDFCKPVLIALGSRGEELGYQFQYFVLTQEAV